MTGVGPLAMTRKACPPAQQADDDWLSSFLTSDPALRVEGTTLTLGDDGSGMTLQEREDAALVGTRWVDGLVSADAVSSLPAGVTADLTIDSNSTQLSVSTGMQQRVGRVTVEDSGDGTGTLVVGPVATPLIGAHLMSRASRHTCCRCCRDASTMSSTGASSR